MAKKAKSSLGVTFWVALLVFLGLLYAANKINLSGLMGGSSGFVELFGGDYRNAPGQEPEQPEAQTAPQEKPAPPASAREEADPPPGSLPASNSPAQSAPSPKPAATPAPGRQAPASPAAAAPGATPERQRDQPKTGLAAKPAETTTKPESSTPAFTETVKPPEAAPKTREAVLYFIQVSESGDIALSKTLREIRSAGAPLTDTLRALMAGPTEKESRDGCTSLIPAGSSLLSVTVKDGVAFANFDESFRFNSFGREGYDGQIRQIVYTATEFSTIQAVQILINGGVIDYLGSEGIYIGKPVGREAVRLR
jgi:spore germination protein GerM